MTELEKMQRAKMYMQNIVLGAAGAVDVPERLAGQIFRGGVVSRGFDADDEIVFHGDSS